MHFHIQPNSKVPLEHQFFQKQKKKHQKLRTFLDTGDHRGINRSHVVLRLTQQLGPVVLLLQDEAQLHARAALGAGHLHAVLEPPHDPRRETPSAGTREVHGVPDGELQHGVEALNCGLVGRCREGGPLVNSCSIRKSYRGLLDDYQPLLVVLHKRYSGFSRL